MRNKKPIASIFLPQDLTYIDHLLSIALEFVKKGPHTTKYNKTSQTSEWANLVAIGCHGCHFLAMFDCGRFVGTLP